MTVPHTQIPILRNVEVERELQSVWWLNAKVNVTRMRSVWYSNQSDNQIRVHEALQCIPNTCILNINAVIHRSNQFKALTVSYKDWQRNQKTCAHWRTIQKPSSALLRVLSTYICTITIYIYMNKHGVLCLRLQFENLLSPGLTITRAPLKRR